VPEARLELACLSTQASEVDSVFAGHIRPTPLQRRKRSFFKFQLRQKPANCVQNQSAGVEQSVERFWDVKISFATPAKSSESIPKHRSSPLSIGGSTPSGWASDLSCFSSTSLEEIVNSLSAFVSDATPEQIRAWQHSIPPLKARGAELLKIEPKPRVSNTARSLSI
jgi:hypothetical protein